MKKVLLLGVAITAFLSSGIYAAKAQSVLMPYSQGWWFYNGEATGNECNPVDPLDISNSALLVGALGLDVSQPMGKWPDVSSPQAIIKILSVRQSSVPILIQNFPGVAKDDPIVLIGIQGRGPMYYVPFFPNMEDGPQAENYCEEFKGALNWARRYDPAAPFPFSGTSSRP